MTDKRADKPIRSMTIRHRGRGAADQDHCKERNTHKTDHEEEDLLPPELSSAFRHLILDRIQPHSPDSVQADKDRGNRHHY